MAAGQCARCALYGDLIGHGNLICAEAGQKKTRPKPGLEVWERMPERQVSYDPDRAFVQVRNRKI